MLSFSIKEVNYQLDLFFNQVGIRNYPKKLIDLLIALFLLFVINCDVMLIIDSYIQITKIYYYLSVWLNILMYRVVNLAVIAAFYFLGDFGFEVRTN